MKISITKEAKATERGIRSFVKKRKLSSIAENLSYERSNQQKKRIIMKKFITASMLLLGLTTFAQSENGYGYAVRLVAEISYISDIPIHKISTVGDGLDRVIVFETVGYIPIKKADAVIKSVFKINQLGKTLLVHDWELNSDGEYSTLYAVEDKFIIMIFHKDNTLSFFVTRIII